MTLVSSPSPLFLVVVSLFQLAREHGIKFLEVSVEENINVKEVSVTILIQCTTSNRQV